VTPATEVGVTGHVWSVDEIVALLKRPLTERTDCRWCPTTGCQPGSCSRFQMIGSLGSLASSFSLFSLARGGSFWPGDGRADQTNPLPAQRGTTLQDRRVAFASICTGIRRASSLRAGWDNQLIVPLLYSSRAARVRFPKGIRDKVESTAFSGIAA
jgi:hypothetical protein